MNYEKKYKEALEWARKVMQGKVGFVLDDVLEKFPELKESEDEKMMNQLHSWMKEFGGAEEYTEKVYQWVKGLLEKQDNKDEEIFILKDQIESLQAAREALKEVHKIELEKQGGQKPAWSEDDDVGLGDAMWAIEQARTIAKDENDIGNLWCAERWLKALKDRVQPKQWLSKEDEEIILKMMFVFTTRVFPSSEECGSFVDFLKSLKPTWKPSDEQMNNK